MPKMNEPYEAEMEIFVATSSMPGVRKWVAPAADETAKAQPPLKRQHEHGEERRNKRVSAASDSYLDKARREWECPICLSLPYFPWRDPVFIDSCQHATVYCRSCIESTLPKHGHARTSCPVCKAEISAQRIKSLKTGNVFAWRKLLQLNVPCPLSCDWEGDMVDLDAHWNNCENSEMQCGLHSRGQAAVDDGGEDPRSSRKTHQVDQRHVKSTST